MKVEIEFKNKKSVYINLFAPIVLAIGLSLIAGSFLPLGTVLVIYGVYIAIYGEPLYKLNKMFNNNV